MSSYIGRHAELYDLFYANKDYQQEVSRIHTLIQKNNKKAKNLLELACGTGTHATLLSNYGYNILATDYSESMIACAGKKLKKNKPGKGGVKFDLLNMKNVSALNQKFDAIYCMFDSIGYLQNNHDIFTTLKGVYDSLNKGGVFIFEFWHAGAMVKRYDALRVRNFPLNNTSHIQRISETSVNLNKQTCSVKYTITEFSKGQYHTFQETQENRFFLLQEMIFFVEQAGFKKHDFYEGFTDSKNITDKTYHILGVLVRQ